MKKQHIKEIMCQAKQGKQNMKKLNRAQKCSILGPKNLGSRGGAGSAPEQNHRLRPALQHVSS